MGIRKTSKNKMMCEIIDVSHPDYGKSFWISMDLNNKDKFLFNHMLPDIWPCEYNKVMFNTSQFIKHILPTNYILKPNSEKYAARCKFYGDKTYYDFDINDFQKTIDIHPELKDLTIYVFKAIRGHIGLHIPPKIFFENIHVFDKLYYQTIDVCYVFDTKEWVYTLEAQAMPDNRIRVSKTDLDMKKSLSKDEYKKLRQEYSKKRLENVNELKNFRKSDKIFQQIMFLLKSPELIDKHKHKLKNFCMTI